MSRWWRAHDDSVDNPKLGAITDKQHRAWFNLCCICSQNGGTLPPIGVIAFKLRVNTKSAEKVLAEMIALHLVDVPPDGSPATMHDWGEWQYKTDNTDNTTARRSKRYRDRKRDGDRDGGVTATVTDGVTDGVTLPCRSRLPETETETETETEKKDAADAADLEVELFRRGKTVLGKNAGGVISQLLAAKDKNIALARAAIEQASTKENPREYIGAIIRNHHDPPERQRVDPRL